MMIFGLRFAFTQLFPLPKEEHRVICLPAAYVQSLRATAQADIQTAKNGENVGDTPFVSEGDVISAWWTRHILSYMPHNPSQTIALTLAFELRSLLAKDMLPASRAYIANAITTVFTFLSARDVLTKPLGYVAAAYRKAIVDLGTREQIEARMALDRTSKEQTGHASLFGDPWMHMVICSNWTKGKYFDIDFSAAVVKEGHHLGGQTQGRPSYIHFYSFAQRFPLMTPFVIIGRDADGNYWLQSGLKKEYWPKFEQALSETP